MGRYAVHLNVNGDRSAHNSPQDEVDRMAWKLFAAMVRQLADEKMFRNLNITVDGPHE